MVLSLALKLFCAFAVHSPQRRCPIQTGHVRCLQPPGQPFLGGEIWIQDRLGFWTIEEKGSIKSPKAVLDPVVISDTNPMLIRPAAFRQGFYYGNKGFHDKGASW